MKSPSSCAVLSLVVLCAGVSLAQLPGKSAAAVDTAPTSVIRTAEASTVAPAMANGFELPGLAFDVDGEGRVIAAGRSFKAAFGTDGFEFIPFLGADAPRNFPLAFRGLEVFAGGKRLALEAGQPQRSGERVGIARGPVEEIYAVSETAVEQMFHFANRPGAGDLVVRLQLHTELGFQADENGFAFKNALGGVHYGRAYVVDARGMKAEIPATCDGEMLTLTVPAAIADEAVFPLTIDPVVATISGVIADATKSIQNPDCVFEAGAGRWLVVAERLYSATDTDVASMLLDADGNTVPGSSLYLDFTTSNCTGPKVASLRAYTQFLTVWTKGVAGVTTREVWGRTRESEDATSSGLGAQFAISASIQECFDASVGGDPNLALPTYYAVVWTRAANATDNDVHARLVRNDSAIGPGGTILIDNSLANDRNPAISRSNGMVASPLQNWTIAWDRDAGGERDIYARRLHWDGTMPEGVFPVATNGSDTFEPVVSSPTEPSSGAIRTAIAYRAAAVLPNGILRISVVEGAIHRTTYDIDSLEGRLAVSPTDYAIDSDGCRFTLAYSEISPSALNNVYATTFAFTAPSTLLLTQSHEPVASGAADQSKVALAARRGAGGSGLVYLAAWTSNPGAGATTSIDAARFEGRLDSSAYFVLPLATEGLQVQITGTPALGQPITVALTNAVGPRVIALGLPSSPFPVCGNLSVALDLVQNPLFFYVDTLPLVVPCEPALVGGVVAVQGADTGGTVCNNIRVSDAVWVRIL